MSRIEDLAPSMGRFMDAEGKAELEGQALRIADVRVDNANKYGPRWLVVAGVMSTGELITIGLAKNGGRDALFGKIAGLLAQGETVDPVCLYQHQPEKGHPFWTFRSASADELHAAEAAEAAASGDPAPVKLTGDDVPVLVKGAKAK